MGTDASCIVEIPVYGDMEPVNFFMLPRNYRFFDELVGEGIRGYPDDVCPLSRQILDQFEAYGELWMPYKKFLEIAGKHEVDCDYLKKKYRKDARIIVRFDS